MEASNAVAVGEIMMKGPVTLNSDDILDLANDIMQLGRIRHIPILDNGKVVGVLSQRNLFQSALVAAMGMRPKQRKEHLKAIRVRDVMSAPVITASPKTGVKEAARIMVDKKIGCLPVMENDSLVGLVTESDILRYVVNL
ncbi:MAG: CBS domain-containing protein [Candidatus Binatia bacterium]